MDNIIYFNFYNPYPMNLQAVIQNPAMLANIRRQETKVAQQIEAAIKALEKERGILYPA